MRETKNYGACDCGIRGTITRVSLTITHGGSSKDSVWEIESQGRTHLVRYKWSEDDRRYVTSCLQQTIK